MSVKAIVYVGIITAACAASAPTFGQTTTGSFTGGDVGEGLDLDGNFLYAVNVVNAGAGQVRDTNFTSDTSTAGVSLPNWTQQIPNWIGTNYGATTNDDNLEKAITSIRHGPNGGTGQINLDVTQGQQYQLQLLFQEGCCNRGFDVEVDGANIADNFSTGPVSNTQGVFVRHLFTAADSQLNVVLNGPGGGFPDSNPIINAFTLEVIPEPSALALLGIGGIAALRRRRN